MSPLLTCSMVAVATIFLTACGSNDTNSVSTSPPIPDPVVSPVTPEDAPISNLVVLSTNSLQDTDGSGINSQLPFAAYLYAQGWPAPKWTPGSFRIDIYPESTLDSRSVPDIKPLGSWNWDSEDALANRNKNLVGNFYSFTINLNDRDIAIDDARGFEFLVRFTPSSGDPVVTSAVKNVWVR